MPHNKPEDPGLPRVYSVQEVADALGVHRNTIHREVSRGRLRSVRVGHLRRFTREQVAEYLEHNTVETP